MSADAVRRRLLERHRLEPEKAGQIVRLLALTHNLEPAFFDDDLLPNVLGLSRTDDRSYAAGVELQRRLQSMSCRVLMAAPAYRGRPNLRTRVHPLLLGSGRLHAKYLVAEHERAVLMSIGSANLTSSGFRKNREVVGVMLTEETAAGDASVMLQALAGAIRTLEALDQAWAPPVLADLREVSDKILSWHATPTRSPHQIVWSDVAYRLLDTLVTECASSAPIRRINIVSPFWSEDGEQPSPLRSLIERLHSAGSLSSQVEVHLFFDAHALENGGYNPAYPSRFQVHYDDLPGVEVVAHAIDPRVDKNELDIKVDICDARPLHAKVLVLEGGAQALAYAGSANFTRHGLGIGRTANIEAGWLLKGRPRDLRRLLPPTVGEPQPVASGAVIAGVAPLEEEPPPYFPGFLLDVSLTVDPEQLDELKLSVRWSNAAPRFQLRTLQIADAAVAQGGDVLLFNAGGEAGAALLSLEPETVRQILQAREIWVHNQDDNLAGPYPVNVTHDARLLLPLAPGAARPGEEALLAYYRGQISFEELYPDPEETLEVGSRSLHDLERSGVDTSRIQSYRIRAFVEALPGMLAELTRVSGPRPLFEVAFLGETSPLGLARCVAAEVAHGLKSPTAAAFQLVEILRVVREAAACVGRRDPQLLADVAQQAARQIGALIKKVQADRPEAFEPQGAFRRYQDAILGGSEA